MTSVGSKRDNQRVVCEWPDAPGLAHRGRAMSEALWGMSEIIVRDCCSVMQYSVYAPQSRDACTNHSYNERVGGDLEIRIMKST